MRLGRLKGDADRRAAAVLAGAEAQGRQQVAIQLVVHARAGLHANKTPSAILSSVNDCNAAARWAL